MIVKKYRIKKIKEFNYMFRNGKRYNASNLTLIVTKAYLPYSRFGISISSKIGNAVIRNKVKRRIRAIIAEFLKDNTKFDKKNFIFVARPGIENMCYSDLKKCIYNLMYKVQ